MVVVRGAPAGDFDYERHGAGYSRLRQPDPRIAALLTEALGTGSTVVNVGAGAGSYEPDDRYVVAVEPSAAMRAQRPRRRPPAVNATAEQLPFDDDSFDAALAVFTIHQWTDPDTGLGELRRVARGPVVILTLDADALARFWLSEYLPEVIDVERARFPAIDRVSTAVGGRCTVTPVPVPIDCTDGFGEAYYARPEAFLDPAVRAATSGLMLTDPAAVSRGIDHLRRDLAAGVWDRRHGHLRRLPHRIGAIRLVVAHPDSPAYSSQRLAMP